MHHENFFVRPHWPLVRASPPASAGTTSRPSTSTTSRDPRPAPLENAEDDPEARDFDLRCVALQLASSRATAASRPRSRRWSTCDRRLDQKQRRPPGRRRAGLHPVTLDEATWQRATLVPREVRRELRLLVVFIDPRDKREPVYTNFEDELSRPPAATDADIPCSRFTGDLYRRRVTEFIRGHQDHLTIAKLRANKPLTPADLDELERLLLRADVGESKDKLLTLYGDLGSLPPSSAASSASTARPSARPSRPS
jgi:type I restriction enzyme R subunit